ncbi:pyruvate dehydrogenase (acetyl-transferring), homodimeric type [candidate division KSB3 bacterium]|uniref:Pyruvate dehydrogenase E1 component n=1 Tax=candidate division KSB3 bacterium TaxID=2044937 RepID=A0A9D5Q909_9BACT|nr:pyruvate dehydrogenase (acetyl-transferring), homodimeric type [candidate division KSB3 bacterium]MBD3327406.1 pyruvate dehydrogenase (acetyl-transferring), homodimeric type [candidate division KSB3 bacterium]
MARKDNREIYEQENQEWIASLDYVIQHESPERVQELLGTLQAHAQQFGIQFSCPGYSAYINTISADQQVPYPGNREIERRIKSLVRWNAMAMVVRANRESSGIGGHISTYASAATLWEVAFTHFLRGSNDQHNADLVYFQGHAAPGAYARSFLEGRLSMQQLENFRRELKPDGGLSSYPHPRLMPEYWQFPTVSMGLAPIQAIYQARFMRYLEDNGLKEPSDQKVWAFLGDGEMDEPESLGAITLAARERLDNLIFVVNCNLQRLDGPVRGNGQIIQELEAAFRGAGWNVIKVIWGSDWDVLFEKDTDDVLVSHLGCVLDGEMQKYAVEGGEYIREHFFGRDPKLLKLVENYSDEQLQKLRRGGHDPVKVYNAYHAAVHHEGSPTVILAHTIKGYGLGEAGEGRNITHQQKKLNEAELKYFRSRFGIPLSDEDVDDAPFYKPDDDSEEMKYLLDRRKQLGGFLPQRATDRAETIEEPAAELFQEFLEGSGDREVATTMVLVHLLSKLLKTKPLGERVVPIVPDESRTFGMDALFRKVGIYSHKGQMYEPVDKESLLYYKEAKDGALLEEGITEAGSLASFIAAGTSDSSYGITMIPCFIFYSMFGFQRVGDLIWAAADARARGFLVGGTSGRTTLPGEGLQHQDGQSHLFAFAVPNVRAYDPAFAYEVAVIVQEGIRRMFIEQEDLIYYLTVMNEKYAMPPMPDDKVRDGILNGMYRFKASENPKKKKHVNLLGSGAILNEVITAGKTLEEDYGVSADIWSVTGYKQLYDDANTVDRWNRLHPDADPRQTYIRQCFPEEGGIFVAASDYVKAVPLAASSWFPGRFTALGTDGFGHSDDRAALRDHFEVDHRHIVLAALAELEQTGAIKQGSAAQARDSLNIASEKPHAIDI